MNANDSSAGPPQQAAIDPRTGEWLFGDRRAQAIDATQAIDRLGALCALGQAVYSSVGLDELFEAVVRFLDRLLEPEHCFVGVFGQGDEFLCVRAKGFDVQRPLAEWPLSHSILRRARDEYVALLSSDAQSDEHLKQFESVAAYDIHSVICVPLGAPGKVRGTLYLDRRLEECPFRQADLLFVTAVSRFLELAVEHDFQLREARARAALSEQHARCLQKELFQRYRIVGTSKAILQAYDQIKRIAAAPLAVVLVGETGTGKELFARALHLSSPHAAGPFVVTHLAAINPNLVESELFGHERGAFTGATEQRIGVLEEAHGGTLLLDEVARIPQETQVKLLRAIETRTFRRVGGTSTIQSDFRVAASTNADLKRLTQEGRFLPDLYYRLAQCVVTLPPLRDRTEDIPLLVRHFLGQERIARRFTSAAMAALKRHPWPGNVRELRSAVLALAWTVEADPIDQRHVRAFLSAAKAVSSPPASFPTLAERLAEVEREHIARALEIAGGNKSKAMQLLGMSRATFFERLKRYRL